MLIICIVLMLYGHVIIHELMHVLVARFLGSKLSYVNCR